VKITLLHTDARVRNALAALWGSAGDAVTGFDDGKAALAHAALSLPDALVCGWTGKTLDALAVGEKLYRQGMDKLPALVFLENNAFSAWYDAARERCGAQILPADRNTIAAACTGERTLPAWVRREVHEVMAAPYVPRHLVGYRYLVHAVGCTLAQGTTIGAMNGAVYGSAARRFGVSISQVERTMRFAIEAAFDRTGAERVEALFGYTVRAEAGRPSNSEFVAMTAQRVRRALMEGA